MAWLSWQYTGYQTTCYLENLWLHKKAKRENQFIYVTCFTIVNYLIFWDPPVNYYSISQRQGSTFNQKHSVSWHQLSGTLCLQLQKVPLPSPLSKHIWKLNCSLLHTTRSNISSAAGTSNSNSRHTAPPINVFDIDVWSKAGIPTQIFTHPSTNQAQHWA